jgi:hypothetical protein
MKQALAKVLKTIAGVAGVVFLFAPLTDNGILVSVAALFVAIITGVLGTHLGDGEGQSGYWPTDPNPPAH